MKKQYELTGNAGGESELGAEKNHIGGYGGENIGFSFWGGIKKAASGAVRFGKPMGALNPANLMRRRGRGGSWRAVTKI